MGGDRPSPSGPCLPWPSLEVEEMREEFYVEPRVS
jgi:hypothetical protein